MISYKQHINENDICELLKNSPNGIQSFRYFNKRPTDIVNKHKYNVMCFIDSKPVGYGHLDYDDNKLWLGILISDLFVGQGYGKIIMNNLIEAFNQMDEQFLYLTVDKINLNAQKLYKLFGFELNDDHDNYYEYILRKG